ncbi:GNAT family N-acetyltransferase [Deinococcus sp. YIM 134068]|uniref:GNAT family N-acetyltransferase n=1 Tax=Deinococcus lichenicola TaxID=3118910 RepID=UPI002F9247F9
MRRLDALFSRCADSGLQVNGVAPGDHEAGGIFENVPPGVAPDRKATLGVFDGAGQLVGVLEALCDHPEAGTWDLGLMLLEPGVRGRGAGAALHGAFAAWVRGQGGRRVVLSVVEENGAGLRFWRRLGYKHTRRLPPARFPQEDARALRVGAIPGVRRRPNVLETRGRVGVAPKRPSGQGSVPAARPARIPRLPPVFLAYPHGTVDDPPAPTTPAQRSRITALDWSRTPLGPQARGPHSLRAALDLVLSSALPSGSGAWSSWTAGRRRPRASRSRRCTGPWRSSPSSRGTR